MTPEQQVLKEYYGIEPISVRPLQTTGGSLKGLFEVGSLGAPLLLKRYRSGFRSLDDLIAIHNAQRYLEAAGIPTAPVVRNQVGEWITAHGATCWVLYHRIDGRHPIPGEISLPEAVSLGETLAAMAHRLVGWQTDWTGAEDLQVYPADERIDLYRSLLELAGRGETEADQRSREALAEAVRGLEQLAHLAPSLLAMERQWVHGDPNEGNLLLDRNGPRVIGVIDFDNMRLAPRGFDFMYCLTSCFPKPGPARDAFASAYLSRLRPDRTELELYAPLWAYRQLCDLWEIEVYYLRPDQFEPGWKIPGPSLWWSQEMEQTREWLLSF